MLFSVPCSPAGHLGSHSIMPVAPTSPFCPNYLRKQSEVRPSGKFCRNGLVTSVFCCVSVSLDLLRSSEQFALLLLAVLSLLHTFCCAYCCLSLGFHSGNFQGTSRLGDVP